MRKRRDNLDEFISALKKEPVPGKPPREVVEKVLQELGEAGAETAEEEIRVAERIKALKSFTKVAVAAVIIIAVLVGVKVFTGPGEEARVVVRREEAPAREDVVEVIEEAEPASDVEVESELEKIERMFAAGDVEGLLAMLSEGRQESKLVAAVCLGRIGDLRAVEALEKLSAEYGEDEADNLFAAIASQISGRLEQEKREAEQISTGKGEKTIRYSGVVTDAAGEPIEGASVRSDVLTSGTDFKEGEAVAQTDGDGFFEIGPLFAIDANQGERYLFFEHPDFSIGWFRVSQRGGLEPNDLEVTLFEPAIVAGTVADERGNPIEGAVVEAQIQLNLEGSYQYFDLRSFNKMAVGTDADGWFAFEKVPEAARLHLDVTCRGYGRYSTKAAYEESDEYPVRAGEDDVVITLKPGGFIKGRFVLEGKPYEKSGIVVFAEGEKGHSTARTDETGRFEIIGLLEGTYIMGTDDDEFAKEGLVCEMPKDLEVTLEEEGTDVELVLWKGIAVTVRVVDEDSGEALRKAAVRAALRDNKDFSVASNYTNDDGECTIGLSPGEYTLWVQGWRDGKAYDFSEDFVVEGDSKALSVEISVTARPRIYGWLVDADGESVRGNVWFGGQQVNTTEQGEFELSEPEGEPDEIYTCYAFDEQKNLGRGFFWQRGDGARELEIVVEPFGSIVGRIVDANGEGVVEVQPQIGFVGPDGRWRREGQKLWDITLDDDGWFRIDGIPIGLPVVLNVPGRGEAGAVEVGQLKPGQVVDVNEIVVKDTEAEGTT